MKNNKKYTKKHTKKNKQWHKLLNINDQNFSRKQKNITKKKICYKNTNISRICESAKYTTYRDQLYNKENVSIVNRYVSQIHDKYKKYRKYKIPMDKRTHYMIDKFKHMNAIDEKHKNLITNDFYNYVNLQWMKEIVIEDEPKYYVEVDNFRIIQEKVFYELVKYVNDYIKNNKTSKKAIAIKNVYNSMFTESNVKMNIHVKQFLEFIDVAVTGKTKQNIYDILSEINSNEIISWGCPIQWQLLPDEKNVKKYISHLSMAKLSIYDYVIYIDDPNDQLETKKYKAYIKKNFFKYLNELFSLYAPINSDKKNHKYNPQDIWDVEIELLTAMGCNSKSNDNIYNSVSAHELETEYDFNWTEFCQKLGYKEIPKKIIVSNLDALKCTIKLLNEKWNSPKWKTYWLYIYLRQISRFNNKDRKIYFNFFEKIIQGNQIVMPDEIYPITGLSLCFNTFLTEQYKENNNNQLYIDYTEHLCNDLRTLFYYKMYRNTWLDQSTKKEALNKLMKLKLVVGSPEDLRKDPIFDYKSDDPWYNMLLLIKWKHSENLSLEGKEIIDIPRIDWTNFKIAGTQSYTVNAFYRPTSNSIYIPLAYLQPPFIDLKERGLEYNLAFLGYTIAHELSHCFDANGSKFDENGNLNDWWTKNDKLEYQKKIKDVINQYESYAKRDGIEFDAAIGVSESLADISGMALIEEYLRDVLVIDSDIDVIRRINLKKLYYYLAIQGKQKIYKNAIKSQLKVNPHPLEKYRVNCPLSRMPIFKAIFDVKKGDGMWWHNDDSIW
jgi:putative endopeptidase